MKENFKFIDVAKCICIISIIFGHFGLNKVNNIVFMYHVACFFIISGFTLNIEKDTFYSFSLKKFKRLMIPYFITSIFLIIFSLINVIFVYKSPTILNMCDKVYIGILNMVFASGAHVQFGNVYIGSYIGAIWFLPALFFSLLFSYILILFNEKKAFIFSIIISFLSYISTFYFFLPFSIQPALFSLPFVIFGYYSRKFNYIDFLVNKKNKNYIYLFLSFIICLYSFLTNNNIISFVLSTSPDYIITLLSTFSASFLVFLISLKLQNVKFFRWIGKNSLIILCSHIIILNTFTPYIYYFINKINMLNYAKILEGFFHIFISFLFIFFINIVKVCNKKIKSYKLFKMNSNRLVEIDISKGIIILLMIVGHFELPYNFRNMIYSFHMPAFIIFSGYFYNQNKTFKEIFKLFLYYLLFVFVYIVKNKDFIVPLFSISFSNKFFTNISTVGPIYFVTMLICIKIIYFFINKYLKNDFYVGLVVLAFSLFGVYLSKIGLWLPYSLDIAFYSLIFYYLGYMIKKYNVILYVKNHSYLYFLLSIIWVTFIYFDRFELAVRVFGNYSFAIISAVSATLLLLLLSNLLKKSVLITYIMSFIGKNTIWFLLIETLLNRFIYSFVSNYFDPNYVYFCIFVIFLDILIVVFINLVIKIVDKLKIFCKSFIYL